MGGLIGSAITHEQQAGGRVIRQHSMVGDNIASRSIIGTVRMPAFDFGFTYCRAIASQLRSTRRVATSSRWPPSTTPESPPAATRRRSRGRTAPGRVAGVPRSAPRPRRAMRLARAPSHPRQAEVTSGVRLRVVAGDRPLSLSLARASRTVSRWAFKRTAVSSSDSGSSSSSASRTIPVTAPCREPPPPRQPRLGRAPCRISGRLPPR
jgi:hypothetical protein